MGHGSQEDRFEVVRLRDIFSHACSYGVSHEAVALYFLMLSLSKINNGYIEHTTNQIAILFSRSKTSTLSTLKELLKCGMVVRVRRGVYMCHPHYGFCGSKANAEIAMLRYKRYFEKSRKGTR